MNPQQGQTTRKTSPVRSPVAFGVGGFAAIFRFKFRRVDVLAALIAKLEDIRRNRNVGSTVAAMNRMLAGHTEMISQRRMLFQPFRRLQSQAQYNLLMSPANEPTGRTEKRLCPTCHDEITIWRQVKRFHPEIGKADHAWVCDGCGTTRPPFDPVETLSEQ